MIESQSDFIFEEGKKSPESLVRSSINSKTLFFME